MIQDFFNWDAQIFLYFNNLGEQKWDWFWLLVTEKKTWIPLYIIFLVVLYLKLGWKKTLLAGVCIALMITCADQFTNILKNYFQRLRPCHTPELQGLFRPIDCEGRGKYGFTSAHASNHIAVAIFIGVLLRKQYKWLIYVLLLWALMIAYSRVYVGVHFTGDVFFGSLIGIVVSYLFLKIYYYFEKKYFLDKA
ncbi:phosphatase PAP2 family protein [Chishuiella changwenlii]|uniref:phosphatase PAP2 family protein n=1 Tax=Chishuiella changwenlii TaxID=1434701 RepID=UPI002FD9CE4C